eukprot:1138066-Pelagomonas_calceolata.AAC.1
MSGVGTTSPDNHQRAKGPWVNACNGEIESVAPKYGCKPFACAIQDCLERHTYNQQVCGRAINNLIECCASLEKPHGSIHCTCPGMSMQLFKFCFNHGLMVKMLLAKHE